MWFDIYLCLTWQTVRQLLKYFAFRLKTLQSCLCSFLVFRGSYYAGLEFHSECYCGKRIYHNQPVRDSLCNATCAGNTTETCGGAPYLSMFQIIVENGQANGGQQAKQSGALDTGLADGFRACLPRPITTQKQSIFNNGYFTFDDNLTIKSCIGTCLKKVIYKFQRISKYKTCKLSEFFFKAVLLP